MPRITITRAAHNAIRSAARNLDDSRTSYNADGTATIFIDGEVLERLEGRRLGGETLSDTIERLVAHEASGGRPN